MTWVGSDVAVTAVLKAKRLNSHHDIGGNLEITPAAHVHSPRLTTLA